MKKLIITFAIISSLAAGAELKDGRYSVQTDKSIWFWYPKTEILVEGGRLQRYPTTELRRMAV